MEEKLGLRYPSVTADSGYESEEGYSFLRENKQKPYIKPQFLPGTGISFADPVSLNLHQPKNPVCIHGSGAALPPVSSGTSFLPISQQAFSTQKYTCWHRRLNYSLLYKAYSAQGRNPAVDPKTMFKILTYAYSQNIYSSRKIEMADSSESAFLFLDTKKELLLQ